MSELSANSGDLDQMPHSVISDLGLHCLPITLLRVSRLQWVKQPLCIKTKCIDYIEKMTIKWSFFYVIYTFLF